MLTKQETINLIEKAKEIINNESTLIELGSNDKNVVVIGDIHGDYEATLKIISDYLNKENILVFVGDYVDRATKVGDSINVLDLLLNKKIENPNNIILLRGNHESRSTKNYGFQKEIIEIYGDEDLWATWNNFFSLLPLAVKFDKFLILHGGVPEIENLNEINNIPKGLQVFANEKLDQILWNDFLPNINERIYGYRGIKHTFTETENGFLEKSKKLGFEVLIRGHQPKVKGYMFNKKCISLQTSEGYAHYPKEDIVGLIPFKGKIILFIDKNKDYKILQI